DVAFGDPEELVGDDLLDFAGGAPARALAIPKAQQFAEKAHAYTFPWTGRLNTRTKDLVDLVVLIERGPSESGAVRSALGATSARGRLPRCPRRSPSPGPHGRRTSRRWPRRRGYRRRTSSRRMPSCDASGSRWRRRSRRAARHPERDAPAAES